jgi:hypothetical protein
MAEINTYYWKELPSLNREYIEANSGITSTIEIKDCVLTSIRPFFDDDRFISHFIENYQFFTISNSAKKLIDNLLVNYKIDIANSSFYLLSAIFQEKYISYYESPPNMAKPLYKDYQNERKDLEILLDILYIKLSQGSNNVIKSISFKTEKSITINNFFIVDEVLDTLIKSYDLKLENFEKRKQTLINKTNNIKLELFDEHQKWLLIKGLYNYISKDETTNKLLNKYIRFVGSFIHISQIPINKTHFEVISNEINTIISEEEIKYLNIFLKRPKSFFVK